MYKLLIVDDEDFEREAIAKFVPWEKYDIELIGTAQNGEDALKKMEEDRPEIVITDLNMPVMDGIELIDEAQKKYPEIIFSILSGYSEFEYTSKAMNVGIRHYILKPCNEEKIVKVMEKIKEEIEKKREEKKKEDNIYAVVTKLLPRAREQVFQNILLNRETLEQDYNMFYEELIQQNNMYVFLLAIRNQGKGLDYLEQFVIGNVLCEVLGDYSNIISTAVGNDIIFMIPADMLADVKVAVEYVRREFMKISADILMAAASKVGKLKDISRLYEQVQSLFIINTTQDRKEFIYYGMFQEKEKQAIFLIDYTKIREIDDYGEILFELYLAYIKLTELNYSMDQKSVICKTVLQILFDEKSEDYDILQEQKNEWELIEQMYRIIISRKNKLCHYTKNDYRMQNILLSIYQNMQNVNLSIQFLTKEVLFMNEDYFGRIFSKYNKKKFSSYILETRIGIAKRVLINDPEIKIAKLAELVGYASDGQYFSKSFRKVTGIPPMEYRNSLREKQVAKQ